MGLQFRKSITLCKGVKLNVTKTGVGVTVGKKGCHCSINSSGRTTASVGLPGTGLYYTKSKNLKTLKKEIDKKKEKKAKEAEKEAADKLGYRQSTVANKLRLLKLPEYIKKAISQDIITERHARALLNVPSEQLKDVYETVVKRNYTVSKTEEYVRELSTKHKRKGVSNNLKIGINTIKEAYELCRKSGIDADLNVSEYEDNVKIVIKMKK